MRATDEGALGFGGHAGAGKTQRTAANSTHVVVNSVDGQTKFAAEQNLAVGAALAAHECERSMHGVCRDVRESERIHLHALLQPSSSTSFLPALAPAPVSEWPA